MTPAAGKSETIVILDFGSQYAQLIARRVRDNGVYSVLAQPDVTADDIRASFNDHEVILGLGLQSVLNMPVRYGGKTLGTINLLHEFDFYSAKDLEVAALLAEMLVSSLHGEAGFQGDRT